MKKDTATIHKYNLSLTDHTLVAMPEGGKPLYVAFQGPYLCLWALVDPSKKLTKRGFRIVGTGHDAPSSGYIGTALMEDGQLVLHVFDDGG